MDIYDNLVETWDKHLRQKHENKLPKYEKDWSCPKCYSGKIGGRIPIYFTRFWKLLQIRVPEIITFNQNTVTNFVDT